jgi:ribulose-phosphate 3-epimerase
MIRIAPSILSADFGRLGEQVAAAEAGGADCIHCDVMDGHFVPNLTFGPLVVEAVRRVTSLPLDVHLMIEQPERYIPAFVQAGATSLSVHGETCPHLHRTIQQIHELGARASVALNPATPLNTLDEILIELDMVLVMTVNPGFGGQAFIEASLDKVRRLRARASALEGRRKRLQPLDIEVDGGINVQTVGRVVAAGANVLVAGSAIFGSSEYAIPPQIRARIGDLRQAAAKKKPASV